MVDRSPLVNLMWLFKILEKKKIGSLLLYCYYYGSKPRTRCLLARASIVKKYKTNNGMTMDSFLILLVVSMRLHLKTRRPL